MSDEEVEIIHSSQHVGIQKSAKNTYKDLENIKSEN